MRIEQTEQGVGQFREFVVQPVVYAGGEECHAFEQARDVRVVHAVGRETQPAGDLRMRVGELGGQPLDRGQFAFVVGEQDVRHWGDCKKARVHTENAESHGEPRSNDSALRAQRIRSSSVALRGASVSSV